MIDHLIYLIIKKVIRMYKNWQDNPLHSETMRFYNECLTKSYRNGFVPPHPEELFRKVMLREEKYKKLTKDYALEILQTASSLEGIFENFREHFLLMITKIREMTPLEYKSYIEASEFLKLFQGVDRIRDGGVSEAQFIREFTSKISDLYYFDAIQKFALKDLSGRTATDIFFSNHIARKIDKTFIELMQNIESSLKESDEAIKGVKFRVIFETYSLEKEKQKKDPLYKTMEELESNITSLQSDIGDSQEQLALLENATSNAIQKLYTEVQNKFTMQELQMQELLSRQDTCLRDLQAIEKNIEKKEGIIQEKTKYIEEYTSQIVQKVDACVDDLEGQDEAGSDVAAAAIDDDVDIVGEG